MKRIHKNEPHSLDTYAEIFEKKGLDDSLVFAVCAPIGTDISYFSDELDRAAKNFGYRTESIRLTDQFDSNKSLSLVEKIDQGNELRKLTQCNDILAQYGVKRIHGHKASGNQKNERVIFLIRQLKRTEEARLLRQVYGSSFFLIGLSSSEESNLNYLVNNEGLEREVASQLIEIDSEERDKNGQQLSKIFPLSDVFIDLNTNTHDQVTHFLEAIFGIPTVSPSEHEFMMSLAAGASSRSADLSRQVGAVLVNSFGDIIGVGCNEVAKFGGGQYWPGEIDFRDCVIGFDSNLKEKQSISMEIAKDFENRIESIFAQPKKRRSKLKKIYGRIKKKVKDELRSVVSGSRLKNLIEFIRPIHAEEEAILSCSRKAVNTRGATLYTTTFPCHECTKLIIGAGIERVVYVEPYPKSKAYDLFRDSIDLSDGGRPPTNKVVFERFVGIGPRKFTELFSQIYSTGKKIERKDDKTGKVPLIDPTKLVHRFREATEVVDFKESAVKKYYKSRTAYSNSISKFNKAS